MSKNRLRLEINVKDVPASGLGRGSTVDSCCDSSFQKRLFIYEIQQYKGRMNFERSRTRHSSHRPRPLSSFKTQVRPSITPHTIQYAPETTNPYFFTSQRRSLWRPDSRPQKQVLTLHDNAPVSRTTTYSFSRRSSAKRLNESYFIQTKQDYLGKYELLKEIGKGSFGVVHLARDKDTLEEVAIKVYQKFRINQDPAKFKNIRREICIMQGMDHPHIAKLLKNRDSLTKISLTLEYCGEHSLFDLVVTKFPLERSLLVRLLKETLSALAYLHSKNIAHRDIKAQNLLLTAESSVKLIDFGFSIITNRQRKLSSLCGTPNYMAPEVLRREEYVGEYADMWSFGILAYFMAERRFPFRAGNLKELTRVVNQCRLEFKECDQILESVIRRCLRSNPADRISASKLLEEDWERLQ